MRVGGGSFHPDREMGDRLCCCQKAAWSVGPFHLFLRKADTRGFLLDETDYLLADKANERKYNFVLADAFAKAKELKGTLFAKKIFYVTPKVPIDIKLLKNVVTAYGGHVKPTRPLFFLIF